MIIGFFSSCPTHLRHDGWTKGRHKTVSKKRIHVFGMSEYYSLTLSPRHDARLLDMTYITS